MCLAFCVQERMDKSHTLSSSVVMWTRALEGSAQRAKVGERGQNTQPAGNINRRCPVG